MFSIFLWLLESISNLVWFKIPAYVVFLGTIKTYSAAGMFLHVTLAKLLFEVGHIFANFIFLLKYLIC